MEKIKKNCDQEEKRKWRTNRINIYIIFHSLLTLNVKDEKRPKKNPDHDNMIWHNAAPRSMKIGEFRKCKFQK